MTSQPPMFGGASKGFEIRLHKGDVIFTTIFGEGEDLVELKYRANSSQVREIYEAFKVVADHWSTSAFDLPLMGDPVLARRRRSAHPGDKPGYIVLERTGTESNWSWRQPGLLGLCASEEITHWQPLPKGDFS